MDTKLFYYIKTDKPEFELSLEMLPNGPIPLIWMWKGLVGIISKGVIQNIYNTLTDHSKTKHIYLKKVKLFWGINMIVLQSTVGKYIINE